MDEDGKKNGKGHNILKGVLYAGIAGIAGAGIYLLSKYRHLGGRATYTIAGVALLVSAPSLIDVAKTYVVGRNKLEEIRIYTAVKKDSIDAVIRLNAPKDTSTLDITKLFNKTLETSKAMEEKYKGILSDNSKRYEALMEKKDEQYATTVNVLRENTEKLQNTIEELKNVQAVVIPVDNSFNRISGQRNASTNASVLNYVSDKVSANTISTYYLIDADKSDGEIRVYGVSRDGSQKTLSISSKASFAINDGPEDGSYILKNKGPRYGELYPGFLEMSNPVGISGAGEDNRHLEEIQQGASANRTGIRVPNEIYSQIARLVDEKKTIINVHE